MEQDEGKRPMERGPFPYVLKQPAVRIQAT